MSTASTTYIRSRSADTARQRAIRDDLDRAAAQADAVERARARAEAEARALELARQQELAEARKQAKAAGRRLDRLAADCRSAGLPAELNPTVEGRTTQELREWTSAAEAAAARVEASLRTHLTQAAVASIRAAEGEALRRAETATSEVRSRDEEIADIVGRRLSSEVDHVDRVAILAELASLDSGDWKDELRDRIHKANRRAEATGALRTEVAELLDELELREAPLHAAMVIDFECASEHSEFEAMAADAKAMLREMESIEMAADLTSVLHELRYEVNPVNPDLTRGSRHWDITHPDWPEHAVKAVVHADGRFQSEVVRTGGDAEGVELDEQRGWEWCTAMQNVRDGLEAKYETEQMEVVRPEGEVRRVERRRDERAQRERRRP